MWLTIFCILSYLLLLLLLSRLTGKKVDNDAFFRANRHSPWWAVAFGMIGASISGVTFVSVPGMVMHMKMTYLQTCMGFFFGYVIVAVVLLPLYYRLNLPSIYTYLDQRFGKYAYKTGVFFFFISKLAGASIRLFLTCVILHRVLFVPLHINFYIGTFLILSFIWLYTRRNGLKTIVWSDCLQTLIMLATLCLVIRHLCLSLDFSFSDTVCEIAKSPLSRVFVFDNPGDRQYFWKQFLSGIFIVIVMTGLDQDMMQKNLTCRTLRQSQLNMFVNGLMYVPVNLLFLGLGVLLYMFYQREGIALPASGDELLPGLCADNTYGVAMHLLFTLGVLAAALSSADSAMTSLTTCFCIDLVHRPLDERLRKQVHVLMAALFYILILCVNMLHTSSIIDTVYMVCGFTYGPLLGLYAFGLTTRYMPRSKYVPFVCFLSPLLCYALRQYALYAWNYQFGYELLMLNGFLTFLGLLLSSPKFGTNNTCRNCHI